MITIVETIRAVSALVERLFGEAPTTKDVTEVFSRPATYVQPTKLSTEKEGGLRHDTFDLAIIRFAHPNRQGYLDLLHWYEKLAEELLSPIPVENSFVLYPEDVECNLYRNDMVLVCEFRVENYQLLPPEDADTETMENLELSRKE